jgi:hypothetical protein
MKLGIGFLMALMITTGCATKPTEQASINSKSFEEIVSKRGPAATEEETYAAYKTVIFESTKVRLEGLKSEDVAKICNAINNERGNDTYPYYIAFEILEQDIPETRRLRTEYGSFVYRVFEKMHEQRLPYKLHEACLSKSRDKILSAMRNIESVYQEE